MSKRFTYLIWLGAGSASEPADLFVDAERVLLVDARETACLLLKQKYPQQNVDIKQLLVTAEGGSVDFTEYNLAEYSATRPITGLKSIFPGIKAISSERLSGTRVVDWINGLNLLDHNNLLIADIPDSNLTLLTAMQQNGQLNWFSDIRIQTAIEPAYVNAATAAEVITFLQEQGYSLQQTLDNDPDLPWLSFSLNPLWKAFQRTKQECDARNIEIEELKNQFELKSDELQEQLNKKDYENETLCQQIKAAKSIAENEQASFSTRLTAKDVELAGMTQQRDRACSELSELKKQHEEASSNFLKLKFEIQQLQTEWEKKEKQFIAVEQEQVKLVGKLQSDYELVNKHAIARLEKNNQLEKSNKTLSEANAQLSIQQQALKNEMLKAEAQIEIIKDLLLKD